MSHPRALHLIHTTNRRGAEVFGHDLACGLDAVGIPSTTRALIPGTGRNQLDVPVLGRRARSPRVLAELRRLAREVDVVVGHGASTLLAGTAATLGTGIPFVYRLIGDPAFWSHVHGRRARVSEPLRRAAGVVALWQEAGRVVTELHGLDPAKVHVIPNGRNAYHFVPPDDEQRVAARAELGIDADGPVIGYVGSLSWEKRPELAIAAVADLPEVTLVIAGDGPLRAEVAEAARRIGPRVQVLGTVADSRTVMWAIDVLLLTSRTEGMPGVVIEAGLCGVPAVAPDVGGTRDLVSASTGRLLSPTDPASEFGTAVAAVLPQSQELGWAALAHCTAGFTLQASVERWSTLLRQGGERSARGGGPPG